MKSVKIGDFLNRVKDVVFVQEEKSYKRVTIRNKSRGVCVRDELSGKDIGTKRQFLVSQGQFLVSKIDARNGSFGIAGQDVQGAIVTNDFLVFEVDKNIMDIRWFNYFVSTPTFVDICKNASSGTTNRMRLKEEKFMDFSINLPDLDEQQKQVSKFEEHRNKTNRVLEELEKQNLDLTLYKQSLIDETLTFSVTAPTKDDLGEPVFYEIPGDWEWKKIRDITTLSKNLNVQQKLSPDQKIYYLDIDSIDHKSQRIRENKKEYVKNLSSRARRVLEKDMVVYSLVRPYLNNMAIIEMDEENYIGTSGLVAFHTQEHNNYYIFFYLLSSYVRETFLNYITGFNSPSITMKQFLDLEIPIPSREVQDRIVEDIQRKSQLVDEAKTKIQLAREEVTRLDFELLNKFFGQ